MSETTAEPVTETAAEDTSGEPQNGPNGYPEKTRVEEMSPAQQAAYYKHHNRQAEERAKAAQKRLKELEPKAQQYEALEQASKTEQERAVEQARKEAAEAARTEASSAALEKYGPRLVGAEFRAQLAGRMSGEQVAELVAGLNVAHFLTDEGEPDAEAVSRFVAAIPAPAPPVEAPPRPVVRDIGAGYRPSAKPNGVASGEDAFAARHGKKTSA
jgi:hypothetical protein